MYRTTPLLILLAFVLGLWIGFNPEARARAQAAWDKRDVTLKQAGNDLKVSLDHLFHRVSEESPPPANQPVEPKPSNFLGQVLSALQQLWEGLVQLWNSLVHRASQTQ